MFFNIIREIKSYEIYPNYIRTQTFLDVLIKKFLIDKNDSGVPQIFRDLSFINYKKFLNNFQNVPLQDKNNQSQLIPTFNE